MGVMPLHYPCLMNFCLLFWIYCYFWFLLFCQTQLLKTWLLCLTRTIFWPEFTRLNQFELDCCIWLDVSVWLDLIRLDCFGIDMCIWLNCHFYLTCLNSTGYNLITFELLVWIIWLLLTLFVCTNHNYLLTGTLWLSFLG